MCVARRRWWRRRSRCSSVSASRRNASTTTSSPQLASLANSKGDPHDNRASRTQCSQAGIHRRRSRCEGVPGLELAQVQLLHAGQAQAEPLRGRDRRGPARSAALPGAGLAVRVLRRPGRYPLDWTALKAWGSDRPEPERYPGSGGKGYDWPALGWHEFRDPNEEWELTLYRYNANVVRQLNQNVDVARQTKAFDQ